MRSVSHAFVFVTASLLLASCQMLGDDSGQQITPIGTTATQAQQMAPHQAGDAVPIAGAVASIDGRSTWSGQQSAAFNDMFVTAREERGWRLLWQLVGDDPPGPLPEDAMGVAVFLGARPSAGYQVTIDQVLDDGGAITVRYRETPPAPGATTAQILTAPYAVRLVPLSTLPVNYDTGG